VDRLKRVNNIKDNILPIKTIYIPRGPVNDDPQPKATASKTSKPKNNNTWNPIKTQAIKANNPARKTAVNTNQRQNQSKILNWPVKHPKLATGGNFGRRSDGTTNTGIQLAVNSGTPVLAAKSGKVVYAAELKGYGKTVIIDHEDNYFTVYSHLGSIRPLKSGDSLKSGQIIGNTGMSGSVSAPVLHFEVRHLNEAKDPMLFLDRKALK
jgi:murein DD-endopeptidase MepM/ murein hydrolase activator NlpD